MILTLRLGADDQGIVVEAFGAPQHRTGDVDRIVERKLTGYSRRSIRQIGDTLAESGARGMIDLIHQSTHDIVKKRRLFDCQN